MIFNTAISSRSSIPQTFLTMPWTCVSHQTMNLHWCLLLVSCGKAGWCWRENPVTSSHSPAEILQLSSCSTPTCGDYGSFFKIPICFFSQGQNNIQTILCLISCQNPLYAVNTNNRSRKENETSSGTQSSGKSIKTEERAIVKTSAERLVRIAAVITLTTM